MIRGRRSRTSVVHMHSYRERRLASTESINKIRHPGDGSGVRECALDTMVVLFTSM